jgi:hypothetical protein
LPAAFETTTIAALALARQLNQRFPKDTVLNNYWLPTIRAAVELDRGAYSQAIDYLESTEPYELAAPQLPTNVLLYPIYLRGQAYLTAGLPDKAQPAFQEILDYPGLAGNYLLGVPSSSGERPRLCDASRNSGCIRPRKTGPEATH